MKQRWDEIEDYFKEENRAVLGTFNPPATEKELKELEDLIGVTLPKDLKEFYTIHNGQDTGKVFNSAIIEYGSEGLNPISKIIKEWTLFSSIEKEYPSVVASEDCEKGIKPLGWNLLWIPLIADGFGNAYCLDLDPAEGGKKGQIIYRDLHGPKYSLVADSFKHWIDNFIDMLE
jgi:cell wall assembly regulator SMI1